MKNASSQNRNTAVHPFAVCVIGSGLAGSECAWQIARTGARVALLEMRPAKTTPAHVTGKAAELVCSNSLRSDDPAKAVGLLKEEMASLGSLIIRAARDSRVPAGSALAVDREAFSDNVTRALAATPNIERLAGEATGIEREGDLLTVRDDTGRKIACHAAVVATGPLTSDTLSRWIAEKTGRDALYFYDAIAPIVDGDTIDMNVAFKASRWDKGDSEEGDYLNCPMNENRYVDFVASLRSAELVEVRDFDKAQFFEGCLPVEVMAARGLDALRFGPLKPVGIRNPRDPDSRPHAVVQLRQDNLHATLFNLVGFQTRMKWGEQKRILRTIPGLERAEFVRLGSMHRNTYLCSPRLLGDAMELKSFGGVHFAGQITGCEGYVESAAVGLWTGLCLARKISRRDGLSAPPPTTALGALVRHILRADPERFQPMNVNFGLFDPLEARVPKLRKKAALAERAASDLRRWMLENAL